MCDLTTESILESAQSFSVCTYIFFLVTFYDGSGERRTTHSSEWEGTQTPGREWHAHRWPSKVRGAVLAQPSMSSGEWRTHSSEWEGTHTLRRERHAHRWPSMVRGAMLARPTRRATYHRALGSRELIPQNERELRHSEGSGMLIGDPPMVRGAVLARPSMSSWEQRTHSSEWEGTHTLRRERHAHRWPPYGEGSSASSTINELLRAENSFLRMRGNSHAQKGVACS